MQITTFAQSKHSEILGFPMSSIQFRNTMIRPLRDWHLWGILPHSTDNYFYRISSLLVHSTVWIFLACFLLSLTQAPNLYDFIMVVNFSTTLVLAYIKAACLIRNMSKINQILSLTDQLDNVHAPSEQERLQKADTRSRLLYDVMVRFCIFGLTVYIVPQLIKGEMMFPALYPFEWNTSLIRYVLTFLFQSVCNNFIICLMPSIDTYGPAMWSFLTAYIDILRDRLDRLGYNNESENVCNVELKECVRYHINLLK